jgi:hypothetical protein
MLDAAVPGAHRPRTKLLTIACAALGTIAVLFAIAQMFLLPLSHDELHFCHAAWLAQQGERPFADFLFHNSPGILYLLRFYGAWDADFGAEIMVFGRALCAVSVIGTATMLFLLGARLYRWQIGALAAALALPLMVIPYNAETFRKQHWSVRPEILTMPLALLALYLTLRIVARDQLRRPFLAGLFPAACAAVAFFVSPRFSFLCIGLALVVLLNIRTIPRSTILGMLLGASIAPALYLATVGIEDTRTWIVKYVAVVREPSQPRFYWFRAHLGRFLLVASTLQAATFLWNAPNQAFRNLAIVQLALMSATILEPKPSFASWQMSLLLASLLISYLLVALWEMQRFTTTVAWVLMFAALWLYPGRALRNNVRLFRHPELMLSSQAVTSNAFCAALASEKGIFDPLNHPVAARDTSYYWTQFPFLLRALAKAGIENPPLRLVEECLHDPPAVLSKDDLEATVESDQQRSAIAEFLAARYSRTASGYYVRNDMLERLTPVLLPCGN